MREGSQLITDRIQKESVNWSDGEAVKVSDLKTALPDVPGGRVTRR